MRTDKELYEWLKGQANSELVSYSYNGVDTESYVFCCIKAELTKADQTYRFYNIARGWYKKLDKDHQQESLLWGEDPKGAIKVLLNVVFSDKIAYLEEELQGEREGRNNPRRCVSLEKQIEEERIIINSLHKKLSNNG